MKDVSVKKQATQKHKTKDALIKKIIAKKTDSLRSKDHETAFCGGGRCGRDCVGFCN